VLLELKPTMARATKDKFLSGNLRIFSKTGQNNYSAGKVFSSVHIGVFGVGYCEEPLVRSIGVTFQSRAKWFVGYSPASSAFSDTNVNK
jgi:hypothetical protein